MKCFCLRFPSLTLEKSWLLSPFANSVFVIDVFVHPLMPSPTINATFSVLLPSSFLSGTSPWKSHWLSFQPHPHLCQPQGQSPTPRWPPSQGRAGHNSGTIAEQQEIIKGSQKVPPKVEGRAGVGFLAHVNTRNGLLPVWSRSCFPWPVLWACLTACV